MKNLDKITKWMQRAKSNLAKANAGQVSDEIFFEDICFDAQQGVEKALKALCIANEIVFPKTHDIAYLIELLEQKGVKIPEFVLESKTMTEFAVETRYPGEYDPVTEDDYIEALEIANKVIQWVEESL